MSTVSLEDLNQDPQSFLDRVEGGERIIIVREGRAVAELRPVLTGSLLPRPFGLAAGAFIVPDDFDAPLPNDVLLEFEGR
ncbi:type II toxin-antitoxin system Phd/YefM family antitoxin [Planctomicrobium piriforme]|uniref:Antitoxin component of toxin-antitoxin stability system, DNA-binding transcriptional repressor n=1 Tax=Planctomicrobium piriforme TaxID=1576369 RepID=A0A1I3F055_9PLAN|nr:type II toxin-antitoxin system Phd/YefM family antitoxin [Planctomicrobium piriforme]SFI04533.1 Antitoxin component of toxin-antitoxin stability system, DNA-binding transcriptional repressor [Planctomicrobium piriforme]